jgi:hypothetical protein
MNKRRLQRAAGLPFPIGADETSTTPHRLTQQQPRGILD